ncbi:MAG: hypothetical protein HXX17_12595 [Geobacteraceae bacterium]|nr:hypothetical protein [Geobacteraceae bacterium]
MINVTPQPKPFDFDRKVRDPGNRFLTTTPSPTSKQFKNKNFWRHASEDLHTAYSGICAYTCFHLVLTDKSVDHFLPKALHPDKAYEWDNYRLSLQLANQFKDNSIEVLDPFIVQTGWFTLEFPSCFVHPSVELVSPLLEKVRKTIDILKLNDHDDFVQKRCDLMVDFAENTLSLEDLTKRYPFLAAEVIRQGIQSTANTIFKRKTI